MYMSDDQLKELSDNIETLTKLNNDEMRVYIAIHNYARGPMRRDVLKQFKRWLNWIDMTKDEKRRKYAAGILTKSLNGLWYLASSKWIRKKESDKIINRWANGSKQ